MKIPFYIWGNSGKGKWADWGHMRARNKIVNRTQGCPNSGLNFAFCYNWFIYQLFPVLSGIGINCKFQRVGFNEQVNPCWSFFLLPDIILLGKEISQYFPKQSFSHWGHIILNTQSLESSSSWSELKSVFNNSGDTRLYVGVVCSCLGCCENMAYGLWNRNQTWTSSDISTRRSRATESRMTAAGNQGQRCQQISMSDWCFTA